MATAFDIVRSIEACAVRVLQANSFLTDAGLNVHRNITKFSDADPHPLIFIGYPGADKTAEYPGQVRQEKAGEFQLSMEYEVQPIDSLQAAEYAYRDLVKAIFGPGAPPIENVVSYEYVGESHIPRLAGGKYGQMSIFLLIRWIESVGQE